MLLINLVSFGQVKVWEKRIPLLNVDGITGLIDEKSGNVDLLFSSGLNVTPIQIDSVFDGYSSGWKTSLGNKVHLPKPLGSKDFLGQINNEEGLTLFYGNPTVSDIGYVSLDFKNKNSSSGSISFSLEDEKFAQSFSYQNEFYILTAVKNSNKMNLYVFHSATDYEKQELDFSGITLLSPMDNIIDLYDFLKSESSGLIKLSVTMSLDAIDQNLPISLSSISNKANLYFSGENVHITLDDRKKNTVVLSISLRDYKTGFKQFKFPDMDCKEFGNSTMNSFVFDDNLYQLSVCSAGLTVKIYDLESGSLVKSFYASEDDEITFRNSDFFLEATNSFWGERGKVIVGNETSKILSKIRRGDAAIAVRKVDGAIEMKIGGYKVYQSSSPMGGGMPIGGGWSVGLTYKQTDERDYYFKTYLRPDSFEHIKSTRLSDDVQQIIGKVKAKEKFKNGTETIFSNGIDTYWAFYHQASLTLHLYKL